MKRYPLPSAQELNSRLDYDKITGDLLHKENPEFVGRASNWNLRYAGKVAGNRWELNGNRCVYVTITTADGKRRYKAHRIIWRMMTGDDPLSLQIDHIDGNGWNNTWTNLRLATQSQNNQNKRIQTNNKSGFKGVMFEPRSQKWRAQIVYGGKNHHIGLFATAEEAHEAYCREARIRFGEFARAA